jgi:Transcription factor IIIC subunit delta N-term
MDALASHLDPVILNGWPSCSQCISWSNDGEIAVATGDFIQILTPKLPSKSGTQADPRVIGLRQWHSTRIRTNLFTQREWPYQEPADSHTFSIGEEQSLSMVVGLAWSPPGIGPHRRSVLAVLTSNHVLSLWESNGTIEEWSRVAVINQSLGDYFGWVDEPNQHVYRQKRRIQAFAWSPPYRIPEVGSGKNFASKWGMFYMAVANDEEVMIMLRISKPKRGGHTQWKVEAIGQVELPSVPTNGYNSCPGSLFHKAMMTKFPVSSLSWFDLKDTSSASFIHVARRYNKHSIKVETSLEMSPAGSGEVKHSLILGALDGEASGEQDEYYAPQNEHILKDVDLNQRIEEARLEFDTSNSLEGNSIAREWGFASSDTHYAACITFHPSDMVGYTTASLEKCTLVFTPRVNPKVRTEPPRMPTNDTTEVNVSLKLANWILSTSNSAPPILPMDRKLLRNSATYAFRFGDETTKPEARLGFSRLRYTSESQPHQDEMEVDEPASLESLANIDIETCLICGEAISFDANEPTRARCDTGHQYSMWYSKTLLTIANQRQHDVACPYLLFKSLEFPSTVLGVIGNF